MSTRAAALGATAVVALALAGAYAAGDARASGTPSTSVAQTASASDSPAQGVTVSGLGKVSGTPDVLHLRLGINVRRDDVDSALKAANSGLDRVRDSLRSHGVAARDLQTSGLSIQPTYSNKGGITGYEVTESLSAKLRGIATAGKTIAAAAQAGGNAVRIDDIAFDLEADGKLLKSARAAAFADAKSKAQQYADAAGRDLGALTSVSEQVTQPGPLAYQEKLRSSAGAALADVPIETGSQDVTVMVTVVWALR